MKIIHLLFLVPLLSCATKNYQLGSNGSGFETIPIVGSTVAKRKVFPNGLKLVVVEAHSSPTFAYQTWYDVGSRNEVPKYTGLAHLFEHMMFKGTTNHPEGDFEKLMDKAGAEGQNAFTDHDYTVYVQELPISQLELALHLESDRMKNLIVNDESFKTEREVVQNERRYREENNPDGTMYQEIFNLSFKKHSYHWPVIGYKEDLDHMKAEDARAFYKTHYAPNHATVVVVGDVNANDIENGILRHYSQNPPTKRPDPESLITPEPPQTAPREQTLKLNIKNEKLMIAYPIPAITHEDIPAINMLQTVLAEGKSSRLSRALVDTGVASTVGAWGMDNRDPSLFILVASLQNGKKAKQAEEIILREIAKIAEHPPTQEELEQVRNQVGYFYYESLSSNEGLARFIGKYETIGQSKGGLELGTQIQKLSLLVTPEKITAAANRYLSQAKRNTVYGVPK